MAFTNEQKYWLALNGGYSVKGSSEAETDALRAKMLFDADQFSNVKERDELLKILDIDKSLLAKVYESVLNKYPKAAAV